MQSRRLWLPEVGDVVPIAVAVRNGGCAIAEPDGADQLGDVDTVLVGPEGGWAPEERLAAHARGAHLLSLGPRTLRADAVAVSVLSILQFLWEGN